MAEFFHFLMESNLTTVAFIIGAVAFIIAVIGRIKTVVELPLARRLVLVLFGSLLMGLSFISYVISQPFSEQPTAIATQEYDLQEVTPSSTEMLSTPQPSTESRTRWIKEVSQIPESGTQLTWDLSGGQILLLGGGQFQIGDVFCGGDAQRICILIYQASTRQTVTINALVPRQNYVSVTESLSADEALEDKEPLFWIPPNCVSGCQRATVLFFEDGALINKVNLTAP